VIIVVGDAAGAVGAARVSEDPKRLVLLLEAGPVYQPWQFPAIPSCANQVGGDAGHNWGYMSDPGHVGHPIQVKRGKVLGGSSRLSFFPDGLRMRPGR
jgi:choline dehydrogenase